MNSQRRDGGTTLTLRRVRHVRRSTIPNSEIAPAGKHRRGQVTRAGTLSTLPPDLGCWSDNTTYTLIPEAEARGTETQRLARAVCAACTAQQQNSKNKHPVKGGEPASHTHARAHSPCHPRSAKHSTTQLDKHRRARKWQRLPRARHAVRWPQEPCGPAHLTVIILRNPVVTAACAWRSAHR